MTNSIKGTCCALWTMLPNYFLKFKFPASTEDNNVAIQSHPSSSCWWTLTISAVRWQHPPKEQGSPLFPYLHPSFPIFLPVPLKGVVVSGGKRRWHRFAICLGLVGRNIISWRAFCLTSTPFARNLAHVGTRAGMQLPGRFCSTKVTGAGRGSKARGNVRIPDTWRRVQWTSCAPPCSLAPHYHPLERYVTPGEGGFPRLALRLEWTRVDSCLLPRRGASISDCSPFLLLGQVESRNWAGRGLMGGLRK